MQISEQGLALIMEFEGFSSQIYWCPAGKPTIGYGHVIGAGEKFPESGISRESAKNLLKQDIAKIEQAIAQFVAVFLTQHQVDALGSLIYNIGIKAFEKSTLLRFLNRGEYVKAAHEFARWVHVNGIKMPGLIRRRAAETGLFLKND